MGLGFGDRQGEIRAKWGHSRHGIPRKSPIGLCSGIERAFHVAEH
jgi:hypothetical protein